MNKTDLKKKRRFNRNLYPIYSSIGLDYMFYYGIKVLFLSQIKGISDSQIVLATSFFSLFAIITQIPLTILIDKIGKRKGLILGNIINAFSMFLVIICPNFGFFILEEFFSSTATSIKSITEASILDLSIPKVNRSGEFYTKLKRNGYSKYCYMYALSTLLAGFLYDLNPYIPVVLCMGCCILATVLSYSFADIKENVEDKGPMEYLGDLKTSFKFIFKSNRLKPLLVMLGLIWGLRNLFDTYQVILLKDIGISAGIIGLLLAVFQLNRGTMSKFASKLNTKFKNKTLTLMALFLTFSFVLTGVLAVLNLNVNIIIIANIVAGFITSGVEGIYQILNSKYLNNFSNSKILPKIYAANTIMNNLLRMLVAFVGSLVLDNCNIKYTMAIVGMIFTAIVYLLFRYMKPRVGLKPDKYKPEDIKLKV